jgi:type II secretory pathway pseudopilin PulG
MGVLGHGRHPGDQTLKRPRRRGSEGMSAVEVLVSLVIFGIVAAGLGAAMVQASNWLSASKVESGANNIAQGELDKIKRMKYDEIGIPGGNPDGVLLASEIKTVGSGKYAVARTIVYVDDQRGPGAHTGANYKKITVTVDPPGRGRNVTQTTIVAPPSAEATDGKAIINVTLVDDADASITIPGVSATLTRTGGGAFGRTQISDVAGAANFPSLDPNSSGQKYRLALTKLGYRVKPGETLDQAMSVGQIWSPTIKMMRDAGAKAVLVDGSGQPFGRSAQVTLTLPDGSALTQATTAANNQSTFTGFGASAATFLMSATSDDGCSAAVPVGSAVPAAGDTNNTHVFTLQMVALPFLTIHVRDAAGSPVTGASVGIGPVNYTTPATGDVITCLAAGSHTITATTPGFAASVTTSQISGEVTLQLVAQ